MAASPRLPRRPLPLRRRSPAPRSAPRSGVSRDEGRHRRAAERRQVVALQRADEGRRAGRELPVHDDRAERRGRARRATSASSRSRQVVGSSEVVWDTIAFHDIAGLVAGAHKGEGLGNQFLANIRETDAIVHVVRAHSDENVIHSEGSVDPARDIETIETELIFADLEAGRAPPRARRARGARRRQARGRRGGVARGGDRRAARRAARRAPCRCPRTPPTRRSCCSR